MRVGDNSSGPAGFVLAAMSQSVANLRSGGLPLDRTGAPDFDAIKAAGGRVDGVLPGGNAAVTVADRSRQYTIYAAQITPADGAAPVFTKGVATNGRRVEQRDPSDTAIANALQYVDTLPSSLPEAQLRAWQSRADDAHRAGGIDVVA